MIEAILALVAAVVSAIAGVAGAAIKSTQAKFDTSNAIDLAQLQYQQQAQLGYMSLAQEQVRANEAKEANRKQLLMFLIAAVIIFLLFVIMMKKK